MMDAYRPTSGSVVSAAAINSATKGAATSVYRCMSSPSNIQPSHAAMPDFHCCGEMREPSLAETVDALDGNGGCKFAPLMSLVAWWRNAMLKRAKNQPAPHADSTGSSNRSGAGFGLTGPRIAAQALRGQSLCMNGRSNKT